MDRSLNGIELRKAAKAQQRKGFTLFDVGMGE